MARESIDLTGDSPPREVISDDYDDGEVVFLRSVDRKSSARPPPTHTPAVRRTAAQTTSGISQTSIREGNNSFLSSKSAARSSNGHVKSTASLPLLNGNGALPKLDSAAKRVTKAEGLRTDGISKTADQDTKASVLATEHDAKFSTESQAPPNQSQNGSSAFHSGKPSSPSLSISSESHRAQSQPGVGAGPSSTSSSNAKSTKSSRLALTARKATVEDGMHARKDASSHDDLLRLLEGRTKSINKAGAHRPPQNEASSEKQPEQQENAGAIKRASSRQSAADLQNATLRRSRVESSDHQSNETTDNNFSQTPSIRISHNHGSDQSGSTTHLTHGIRATEDELIRALRPSSPYRTKLTIDNGKTPEQAVGDLLHAPSSKDRRAGRMELQEGRFQTQPALGKRPRTDTTSVSELSNLKGTGSSPVSSRTQHLLGPRQASSASPATVEKTSRPPVFSWKKPLRFEEATPAKASGAEIEPVAAPTELLKRNTTSSEGVLTGNGIAHAPKVKALDAAEPKSSGDQGARALKSSLSKKKTARKTAGRRDTSSAPSDTFRPTSSGGPSLVRGRTPPQTTSAVPRANITPPIPTSDNNEVLDLPERPVTARSETSEKASGQGEEQLPAKENTQHQSFTLAQISALHTPASQAAHDDVLHKYFDEMDEDHERSVRYTLARTHQQIVSASPATPFTVKKGFFAQMKDIKAVPKAPHIAGGRSQRLTIEPFPARIPKISTSTVAVPTTPYSCVVKAVPYYVDYVNLGMSILAENEKRLLYQPYFSEDFQEDRNGQIEDLNEELNRRFYKFIEQRRAKQFEVEVARKRYQYLESFWTDVGISPPQLVDYLVSIDEPKAPADVELAATFDTTDVKQALALRSKMWVDDHEPTHSKWVKFRSLRPDPSFTDVYKASLASAAFYKKTRSSIWNVIMLSPEVQRPMDDSVARDEISGADSRIGKSEGQGDTHRSVACRICHVHNCPYHGEILENAFATVVDRDRYDDPHGEKPDGSESESEPEAHTFNHRKHINVGHMSEVNKGKQASTSTTVEASVKGTRPRHWRHWKNYTNTAVLDKRLPFYPCNHPGSSCEVEQCSCYRQKIPCEKTCACPHRKNCSRRFSGCDCAATAGTCSRKENCACWQLNRECDPDVCGKCGAAAVLDPANRYKDEIAANNCANVALQRNRPRKTYIGESEVHGFGLYMGEDVGANVYLGEYKGELLSEAESDRRGTFYKRMMTTYLFTLNPKQQVDAARMANKFRFVNNSDNPKTQNIQPRVMFCNGIFRIGMFSIKKIRAGEEMFFQYNYDEEQKEGFVEKNAPSSSFGRKSTSGSRAAKKTSGLLDDLDEDDPDFTAELERRVVKRPSMIGNQNASKRFKDKSSVSMKPVQRLPSASDPEDDIPKWSVHRSRIGRVSSDSTDKRRTRSRDKDGRWKPRRQDGSEDDHDGDAGSGAAANDEVQDMLYKHIDGVISRRTRGPAERAMTDSPRRPVREAARKIKSFTQYYEPPPLDEDEKSKPSTSARRSPSPAFAKGPLTDWSSLLHHDKDPEAPSVFDKPEPIPRRRIAKKVHRKSTRAPPPPVAASDSEEDQEENDVLEEDSHEDVAEGEEEDEEEYAESEDGSAEEEQVSDDDDDSEDEEDDKAEPQMLTRGRKRKASG